MIYDINESKANEPREGKIVWAEFSDGIHQVQYDLEEWWSKDFDPPKVCADTREELLLHAIQQQKEIIQKAEAEIKRLQGMREVGV
jgi:hypothetical protein